MRFEDISRFNIRQPAVSGEKIVLGMSGGVDSSVAAALLKESGYTVTGLTLKFLCNDCDKCAISEDNTVSRAKEVCRDLCIEHHVVDVSSEFRKKVIDYFAGEYKAGRTPNPCIICNEKVKFPAIAAAADSLGVRSIATGHYAKLVRDREGRLLLGEAGDHSKDQGYFLYRVPVKILKRTVFPLADLRKEEVRSLAAGIGLSTKTGKESQDICFLHDNDLPGFLSGYLKTVEGDVVDKDGKVLGRHRGTFRYTIGQRRGLGIASEAPLYVSSIDPGKNRIVLSGNESLFTDTVICSGLRMRVKEPILPLSARIRYRHRPAKVKSVEIRNNRLAVSFEKSQRAVTSGQSLVLYSGGMIIGGGIIEL